MTVQQANQPGRAKDRQPPDPSSYAWTFRFRRHCTLSGCATDRGSGGIRKLRWRSKGRGKRGGSRVVYYWLAHEDYIYLLTIYGKRATQDLTADETAAWRRAVREIEND